jgi:hypothetical protein
MPPIHLRQPSASRRDLLQFISACGVSLALPAMSAGAASRRRNERPKSLITLWMNGGMSQLETFDPHPGSESGGETRDIPTSANGIRISSMLPQIAAQMHSCMLIRSLTSREGDHIRGSLYVRTGYRPEPTLKYPTLGAIAAHELPDPAVEIPQHVSLAGSNPTPEGGYLGNQWDAFRVFNPGEDMANLASGVNADRQAARLQGLDVVSKTFSASRPVAARGTFHQDTIDRALKMMSSEQLRAFRIDDESLATRSAYGNTSFGRGCLVARRLVEVGVRSVEVTLSGFDTHAANHSGHETQTAILDPALATLIQELRDRDLLESTIVLCISEFGRTPRINPAAGRDHWPNWFSCLVAGGGFQPGVTIGSTPADLVEGQSAAPEDPILVPQLYATIMATMGIDPAKEVVTPIGRPMRFSDAEPLARLLRDDVARTVSSG